MKCFFLLNCRYIAQGIQLSLIKSNNKMNKVNLMCESYDNNYNTMYRYYYGEAANTYKMSTHIRFPDSDLYNNPHVTFFLESPRNEYLDILSSYKEQYPEDEWKLLEDAIAEEGQRLLEEEQEERFLWQEPQPIQEKLSLVIPKDDDDELTDDDECQELTDVDYIEQNHELNIYKMANLRCDDSSSSNMSIVSCDDDDSNSQESSDSWTKWYKARLANGYYDSPGD